MTEKIRLTIPSAVAAYVRPGSSIETRMAGCAAAADMLPFERITLLFCLTKDAEPPVRTTATFLIEQLPEDIVRTYQDAPEAHPLVLALLQQIVRSPGAITSSFSADDESPPDVSDIREELAETGGEEPPDEEAEEFQSKFKLAQKMGIAEKIKMALLGDKEWRSILVKDSNKLVSGSVLKNPRISDGEVLTLVKSGIQNDEIMRLICANKEWIKGYPMRKALIENNRTPVQNALRYLGTMGEKELAHFAKSKNISSVISTMAKRMLLSKKK